VAAILTAPWPSVAAAGAALAICGAAGEIYIALVIRRARGQSTYTMVLEDWMFHIVLPFIAYTALVAAALSILRDTALALFVVGGSALLLLFIGIHNAWDTVTFLMLTHNPPSEPADRAE